jgi:DNA-binding LacI/PurR family transcriptional regulator
MSTKPTIKEVAALADVSIGTVSNVINSPELVSPTKRQRVQEAIAKLGWQPHTEAQRLASKGHNPTIASPGADFRGGASFRAEIVLPIDPGSQAAQAMVVRHAAQQAIVEPTEDGHTTLTLHLTAETVGQAALWLLGLVLPLNYPVLRLEVMSAPQGARGVST